MKIYFLAAQPCALYVNGIFFGTVNHFERFADVSLSDGLFIEFIPENALPIRFFLNENIRFQAPQNCEVFLQRDAISIHAKNFFSNDLSLRLIAQMRDKDTLATVFQQGQIHLSMQTANGFFNDILPASFRDCSLHFSGDLLFLKSPSQLAIYTQKGKRIFLEEVLEWSVENEVLHAILPLSDSQKRTADCQWSLKNGECVCQQFILREPSTPRPFSLLAYAFFECVLIGGNFNDLLTDDFLPEREKLLEFLGDFERVTPTDDENVCGLIKPKSKNIFEVEYYSIEVENGKIADIKKI